ncbi:ATP-binding protein [Paucibacter sp. AS339]|uniref:sensor histidine kinase n=1 Tax=Paucibacter hankyongi TaxID=3133434 RepID=UPI0030AEF91F
MLLLLPGVALAQATGPMSGGLEMGGLTPLLQALLAGMLLMMSASTGLIAYSHAGDRPTGYLSAALLAGGLWALLPTLSAGQAFPAGAQQALALALLVWATWGAVQYLLHQISASRTWIDRILLLQGVVAPLSLVLGPDAMASGILRAWYSLMCVELLLVIVRHLNVRRRRLSVSASPSRQQSRDVFIAAGLLGAAATSAFLVLANTLVGLPLVQYADLSSFMLMGFPLALLGHGLLATVAIGQARKAAEAQQDQMEQAMIERVAEVERSYGEMAEQKLEQVTERERKRIAADLHDDLGAKLLTIVHTSESDRISTLAREALEEMRLSVRGLTGRPVQLLDALGDWRAEVVSRLGQANILAEWKSPPEDIVHTLPARAYVQTTRIFREAVSNIIKHSGGTHCTISCHVQDGDFLVTIQDNGQGIPAELDGRLDRGHGMASMKSRAKQMQGQCLVESGPGWGTVIRLTIPL